MKRFTLILSLLVAMVTTAMGQINYGKSTWTFPATSHEAVSEVPAEIFADFKEQYKVEIKDEGTGEVTSTTYTELTNEKVGVFVTDVRVAAEGDVTATFKYNGGNIRMDISGVDLINADGEVVKYDYHFGYTGGNSSNNTYTLSSVPVGDYSMRLFVAAQKEDITSATSNDSRGTITLAGWLYPEANVFYNIKNVRSSKYATFKGVGNQFRAEDANNTAGSYWYFVEASSDDVKKIANAWLENDEIPGGYKPYYVYNAACEKAVENVGNGYMAAPGESPYPAKLYYIGVKTNGENKGFVLRPCNEDGSSWNDNNNGAVCHWNSGDPGSVWRIEPTNVTKNNLIAMGTTAKNDALTTITAYEKAYYFNPTTAQINDAKEKINGIDCSTKENALTSVINGTASSIAAEVVSNAVTPAAGDRFIMKNRGRDGNNYLRAYAEGGDVKCSNVANDLNALDLVWKLVATDNEGEFKLYNERQGVYVGVLPESNNTKMQYTSDATAAGIYEISQTGVYTLFHAKGQNHQGYIHQSNWANKEIVRWDNGDCSQWQLLKAPFEITTDAENPICYTIKTRATYYYTLSGNNIALSNGTDFAEDTNKHWFFMLDADKNLKIYSLADKENSMGYITVEGGNTKLTNNHSATNYVGDTYTLYFSDNTNNSNEWYSKAYFAFRPTTGNTFVSNHGGTGNKMGFHNDYNDNGTRVEFECVNSHILKQKVASWEPYLDHKGDKVCQYVIPDEVEEAINNIPGLLATKGNNNADYVAVLGKLNVQYPEINAPETGKYYYVNYNGYYLSNVKNGATLTATQEKTVNNIFYFEAEDTNTYLLDYQNGHYVTNPWNIGIGAAAINNHPTERYKQTKSFDEGQIGCYTLKYRANDGNDYHFSVSGGTTNSTADNTANDVQCTLVEVTTLPVTIKPVGFATFYAPVAVEIPENVKAYYLESKEKVTSTYISLTEIKGGVIPANTGVILEDVKGVEGVASTYDFVITDTDEVISSLLTGTVAAEYIGADAYVLSAPEGDITKLGLYTAAHNQVDNTAFLNNSHKAYLPKSVLSAEAQNSNGFRFDFDGTTAIENVEVEEAEVKAIYDLQGRKVENPTKGIYIINGNKVIIK